MKSSKYEGKILHDIGISIIFVMLFICTLITSKAGEDLFTENLVMTIAVFIVAMLALFRFVTLSIVLVSVTTVTRTVSIHFLTISLNYFCRVAVSIK